jgi:hypothetical protein
MQHENIEQRNTQHTAQYSENEQYRVDRKSITHGHYFITATLDYIIHCHLTAASSQYLSAETSQQTELLVEVALVVESETRRDERRDETRCIQ